MNDINFYKDILNIKKNVSGGKCGNRSAAAVAREALWRRTSRVETEESKLTIRSHGVRVGGNKEKGLKQSIGRDKWYIYNQLLSMIPYPLNSE